MSVLVAALIVSGVFAVGTARAVDMLGEVTEYDIPTENASPGAIVEGPDGNLWFTELHEGKIGKMTKTGTFSDYALSNAQQTINGYLTKGHDSRVWFTSNHKTTNTGALHAITSEGDITTYTPVRNN